MAKNLLIKTAVYFLKKRNRNSTAERSVANTFQLKYKCWLTKR